MWTRPLDFTYPNMIPASLVGCASRKVVLSTTPARDVGISYLNKVVGSLSAASTRRHRLRQQPQQYLKRLGTLDFRAARMGPPANTSETRQVTDECSWQTSRVKPVLATFESVGEAPQVNIPVKNTNNKGEQQCAED